MHARRPLGYVPSVATTRTIELKTEIPGPRSREILERTEALSPEQLLSLRGAVREMRPLEE